MVSSQHQHRSPAPAAAPVGPTLIVRLADWSYRRRRLVVVGWVGLLVATIALSSAFGGEFNMSFSTPGAESQEAQDLLEERFAARAGDTIDVVFEAPGGIDEPDVQNDVDALLAAMQEVPHVGQVESPYAEGFGPVRVSEDRTIAFATLNLDVSFEEHMPRGDARALIDLAEAADRDGLDFELSGFAIQGAQETEFSSEGIGLLAAVFILLISFGSFLAMGLPILTALFGLGIATGLIALLCNVLEVPEFAPQVAAMIGIGVGIDYVLFIVTRYRASLHTGHEPREAVITAMTTSGRAVIFAGCVVIISLLGLFTMNLGFLRGLAIAASSGVLVVMLAAVTLIPAVLGFIGKNIDRLKVPFLRQKLAGDRRSLSYRWSRVIQRRPWPFVVVCLVGLVAMALPALDLHFGFPDAGNDPEDWTTRQAYDLMTEGFGPGVNGPLLLVGEPTAEGVDPAAAMAPIREAVVATEGVAASSPPIPGPDGDLAVLFVTPSSSPQAQETQDLVDRLRGETLPAATDGTGVQVFVGGATAASIDATDYVADRLLLFIGAVIVLSFLLLMVVFRSVLVPLKAALMNILSISAAYGVIAMLVDGGWFGGLFGITEPTPIPSFVPMMMFAILFGLSMDYEVFLLSRIREEYSKTGDNAAAVADGLAHTARVITAAAAIMISVFLAFVLGDQVFLKVIGLGLATAIFVDATIVRMILVPSTMELLGDANWWLPGWLGRLLPTFHIEGESEDEIAAEMQELLHAEEERARV